MKQTMHFLALPFFVLFLFSFVVIGYGYLSEEEEFHNLVSLLDAASYDKRIAPEGNDGEGTPVKVITSMHILGINKVDDWNMDFNAQFYFRQQWNDSRLKHKNNIGDITLRNVDKIWTPDLFFVEEREGSLHQVIHPNIFCKIKPNGEVKYSVKLSVTFSCPMDLRNYPHDIQKCIINIESYGFQMEHVYLQWKTETKEYGSISVAEDIALLDFALIDVTPSSRNVSFTFGNYSSVQINLKFKRKFGFFATRLYVPVFILVIMASLSLWIKAEERCLRLSLLLVTLYLMVTVSSEVNNSGPPAPYTKASDVWIGFCESLVFAVFLEFIVVALIAGRESEDDDSKIKGEIPIFDPEAKEQNSDSLKSPLSKLINMFDARNGGKGKRNALSHRIDRICRAVFPLIFILFNIVYWSVYCTA